MIWRRGSKVDRESVRMHGVEYPELKSGRVMVSIREGVIDLK